MSKLSFVNKKIIICQMPNSRSGQKQKQIVTATWIIIISTWIGTDTTDYDFKTGSQQKEPA